MKMVSAIKKRIIIPTIEQNLILKTNFCYFWVWFEIKYKYPIPIDLHLIERLKRKKIQVQKSEASEKIF